MPNTEADSVVHVAVAIIQNSFGQVLLSRRSANVHQGSLWEYPGGKIHAGELVFDALIREIREELGLAVKQATPIMRIPFHYQDDNKKVLLDVWRVDEFKGEPAGLEGQAIQWQDICGLESIAFPEANKSITEMMKLPTVYGITPSVIEDIDIFLKKLDTGLKKGLRLIQVRQPKMSRADFELFTKQVLAVCKNYSNVSVMVNTDIDHALQMGAHGVHLSSGQLKLLPEISLAKDLLISASCHNEQELKKAESIGANFVVLSPVKHTKSHPETIPLGWEKFKKLATVCNLPVFALGGMSQEDIEHAKNSGAVGVSILSGLWN